MPFRKRPGELTHEDIQRLCDEAYPEGSQLELKAALPTKKGKPDPWAEGKNDVSEYARNELIAEVIAFANAHSGWLLLGVEETSDKPARAKSIAPLPMCADLAERLRLMCRDCIEPKIPIIDIEGVPTRHDASGVVAFHVPRSRMAPHRHTQTKECYVRRNDRTEKMNMREIQDLTLNIHRGLDAIDREFEKRRIDFRRVYDEVAHVGVNPFGFRVTAVPLVEIYIDKVYNTDVQSEVHTLSCAISGTSKFQIEPPYYRGMWEPVIRGSMARAMNEHGLFTRSVYCNGVIEYVFAIRIRSEEDLGKLYYLPLDWAMSIFGNALCSAEKFRRAAGVPDIEYGLEAQIINTEDLPIVRYGGRPILGRLGPLPANETLFPRYSVGPWEKFVLISQLFERDLLNAAGVDVRNSIEIDFKRALEELGIIPVSPEG
jgi:hypothetical protein